MRVRLPLGALFVYLLIPKVWAPMAESVDAPILRIGDLVSCGFEACSEHFFHSLIQWASIQAVKGSGL